MEKTTLIIRGLIGISIYLIATGLSFAGFSTIKPAAKPVEVSGDPAQQQAQSFLDIDPSIPKTEACPINGMMYTKQEREVWETRRPLAVMIENHAEARPQSGLSKADVVYEAVAEGGITRFMGIYYCGAAYTNLNLAPVRSARIYYLPWVLEYDALYSHVGGAGNCNDEAVDPRAKALCAIGTWKVKDMDQFGLPYSYPDETGKKVKICFRNYDRLDHSVATEHTMVCQTDGLYNYAQNELEWTNTDAKGVAWDKNYRSWKFKDDEKDADRGASSSATFSFWEGYENDYGIKWTYDRTTNSYKRENGGVPQMDLETKRQLEAKVVIIQFAKETFTGDLGKHLLYNNIGSGEGILFQDGLVTKITWKKADRSARTLFYDKNGKEVSLNKGQIWIELVPTGTAITY